MQLQQLGMDPQTQQPVWVVWFDGTDGVPQLDASNALLYHVQALQAVGFDCPACGERLKLDRSGGVIEHVADTPNCRSVSDRCQPFAWTGPAGKSEPEIASFNARSCQAQIHFDATPVWLRGRLRWPQIAVGLGGTYKDARGDSPELA
jgi:hypothetical protein